MKIILEYWNGEAWIYCSTWQNEQWAWFSLGDDDFNYRTIDENGEVLTDKSL